MRGAFVVSGLILIAGCTKSQPAPAPIDGSAAAPSEAQLIERGKTVYFTNCITCHNADPKLDGSVGPAIAGSSVELITARVSKADYPPGYKPKRPTKVMPAFPGLEKEASAIAAYLNSAK